MSSKIFTIALTGGIGTGKTTISNLFSKLHVPIIDTDIIAREIVEPGKTALKSIVGLFGDEILTDNNTLDRKKLARIIFQYNKKKNALENLLHPLIYDEIQRRINVLDNDYCIIVIPLLYETGNIERFDRVLVIDSPPEKQISRTMQRDNIEQHNVEAIMKNQVPREVRLTIADDVIQNDDDSIQSLEEQVKLLHKKYSVLACNKSFH